MRAAVEKIDAESGSSFRAVLRQERQFGFHWHYHQQFELTLITRGRGKRFVGDHIGQYGPGDLVLLGPNLPHTWYSQQEPVQTPSHEAVVIHFDNDFLGRQFFARPELGEVSDLLACAAVGLEFTMRLESAEAQLARRLPELPPLERLLALLDLLRRLAHVEANLLSSANFHTVLKHAQRRQIDRVCGYINEHYTSELQQANVAAMLEMSAARFSQFFRRSTGRTFVQYVNALRVARACRLLIETDLSITQIGFQSGFSNVSNFNRRFKEIKAMAPRAYRKCYDPRSKEREIVTGHPRSSEP